MHYERVQHHCRVRVISSSADGRLLLHCEMLLRDERQKRVEKARRYKKRLNILSNGNVQSTNNVRIGITENSPGYCSAVQDTGCQKLKLRHFDILFYCMFKRSNVIERTLIATVL